MECFLCVKVNPAKRKTEIPKEKIYMPYNKREKETRTFRLTLFTWTNNQVIFQVISVEEEKKISPRGSTTVTTTATIITTNTVQSTGNFL